MKLLLAFGPSFSQSFSGPSLSRTRSISSSPPVKIPIPTKLAVSASRQRSEGEDDVMSKLEAAMQQYHHRQQEQLDQQEQEHFPYDDQCSQLEEEEPMFYACAPLQIPLPVSDSPPVFPASPSTRHHYEETAYQFSSDDPPPSQMSKNPTPLSQSQSGPPLAPTRLRNFALNAANSQNNMDERWTPPQDPSDISSDIRQLYNSYHAELTRSSSSQKRFIGDDRVEIDVGGKVFRTSKGTLMAHSTYFQNRWMPRHEEWTPSPWDSMAPQGESPDCVFLDQDPQAFGVLLSFMRSGYLEAPDLTANVLALADILGMEKLMRAVKCTSFRYLHPNQVSADEDDVSKRFDRSYGGILPALKRGFLPETIRPIPVEKAPQQIAQLLVYDGWVSNFQKTDLSLFVEVKVTANVLAQEGLYHPHAEGYDTVVVPDCHTIHDAINWLYHRGFEFTEQEYQTVHFPNDHRAWENLWFTRPLVIPPTTQVDILSNAIRFDPKLYPQVERKRRKIASLLISHDQMDAFLYADKGRKTRMGFPAESNGGLPPHIPGQLRNDGFDSKISIESSRNAWAVVSWLSEQGYTEMKQTSKLRKLLLEIQHRAFCHQEDNADAKERKVVDQDEVDFRLLSCEVPPDSKLFETWPTGPYE